MGPPGLCWSHCGRYFPLIQPSLEKVWTAATAHPTSFPGLHHCLSLGSPPHSVPIFPQDPHSTASSSALFPSPTHPSMQDSQQRQKLVQDLHLLKTDIFMQLVEGGAMPLRPGVRRLVGEYQGKGVASGVLLTWCGRTAYNMWCGPLSPHYSHITP